MSQPKTAKHSGAMMAGVNRGVAENSGAQDRVTHRSNENRPIARAAA
jgi:hypothetical protein